MLRDRGLLRADGDEHDVVEALHRFLTWTPARLIGVAVSDLSGDRRTINQPGTDEEYPNWRLPLAGPDGRAGAAGGPDGVALGPPARPHGRPALSRPPVRPETAGPPQPDGCGGPAMCRVGQPRAASRSWAARARVMPSRFSPTSRRRPAGASAWASSQAWVASASSRLASSCG